MAQTVQVSLQFTANTEQAKQQLQNLQQTLNNLGQGANVNEIGNRITTDILKAQQAATGLSTALKNATNVNTGQLNLTKFSTELSKQKMSLADYRQQLQLLGTTGQQAFIQLTQSIRQAEVGFRNTNKFISSMWTNLKNVAKWQISSAVLTSFTSTFSDAFRYAQDLNESLNNIRIVSGQSTEQMAQFAKEANKAAKALSTTTTEYTDAALIFYQQGLNDQQVKERTDITIKMANASQQSAEIVSDQLTAVWNNFDNGTKSLESYADAMVALGAETASSSEEIATGLEKFAAIAETTGLSFEYASAALATVTATTRQSADVVGTAFKTLFARIQDLEVGETLEDGTTLGKYSEALNAVGVNIKDANGGLKDMDIILNELAGVWGNLDRDQKAALAQTVAGTRQYTQLMALMENWDFMERNLQTIQDSTGALQEQADVYAESWAAASDRVKASAEGIYDSLIKDDFIIDLTDGFAGFLGLLEKVIDSMGGFKGVLSAVYLIFAKIFNQQMQMGIANMAQSLYSWTKPAERSAQALQKQAYQESAAILRQPNSGDAQANEYRAQALEKELSMRNEIQNSAHKLTEEQKKQIEQDLELIRTAKERVAQQIEEKNALTKTIEEDQKRLNKLTGGKGGDTKGLNAAKENLDEYKKSLIKAYGVSQKDLKQDTQNDESFSSYRRRLGRSATKGGVGLTAGEVDGLIDRLKVVQEYEKRIVNREEKINNLNEKINKDKTKQGQITKDIEESEKNIADFQSKSVQMNQATKFEKLSASIIGTMNGISSLTMGLSSLTSAWNALKDPDMSGWEKFTSVMMSLSMGLPMVISTFLKLNSTMLSTQAIQTALQATQMSSIITSKLEILTNEKLNEGLRTRFLISKTGLTAEEAEMVMQKLKNNENVREIMLELLAKKNKLGTIQTRYLHVASLIAEKLGIDLVNNSVLKSIILFSSFLAPILGVVAAIATLVIGIKVLVNWWNKDKIAAEEANKSLNEQKKILNETKQAYDDLKSSIENYQNAQKAIDSMKAGTEEWKNKIQEANEIVIDLLNRYPQLAKYIDDTNGRLTISKAGFEEVEKFEKQRVETQRQQVNAAQIRANEAQSRADRTNFIRTKGDYYTASDWTKTITSYGNYGAVAGGAATGIATGGVGTLAEAGVGYIAGAVGGLTKAIGNNAIVGASMEDALDKFSKAYEQQGESLFLHYEAKVKEIAGSNQALADKLIEEKETVQELIRTEKALDKTNQLLTEQIIRSALGEDATDAEVALAASPEYQAAAEKEAKETVNNLVDKEQEYLEKVIGDTKNARIKNGKLERYIDGSWQEQGNISSEDIENRLLDYYKTQFFTEDKNRKKLEDRIAKDEASMRAEGINFTEEQMGDFYRGKISIANFDTVDEFDQFKSWLEENNDALKRKMEQDEWVESKLEDQAYLNKIGLSNYSKNEQENMLKQRYANLDYQNSEEIWTGGINFDTSIEDWEAFQKQQLTSVKGWAELGEAQQEEFLKYFEGMTQAEKKLFLEKADFEVAKNKDSWDKILNDAKAAAKHTKQLKFFEGLSTAQEDLEIINKSLKSVEKNDGYIDNLDKLEEKFGGLGDAWTNFMNAETTEEKTKALKDLAYAYIEQKGLLDSVDASMREMAITQLTSLGFDDARTIVNDKIKEQLYQLALETDNLKLENGELNKEFVDLALSMDFTQEEIDELNNVLSQSPEEFGKTIAAGRETGNMSDATALQLINLKIKMIDLNNASASADLSNFINQIKDMGNFAAGASAELAAMAQFATLFSKDENGNWILDKSNYLKMNTTDKRALAAALGYEGYETGEVASFNSIITNADPMKVLESLKAKAQQVAKDAMDQYKSTNPYTGGYTNKTDNNGGKDKKEKTPEISHYETINKALEYNNKLRERNNKLLENTKNQQERLEFLEKELELLKIEEELLNRQWKEANKELQSNKTALNESGLILHWDGDRLVNYDEVLTQLSAIKTAAENTESKADDKIADNLQKLYDGYVEAWNKRLEAEDKRLENLNEQENNKLKSIIEKFEPNREKTQRELDLIDFRVDINKDDLNGLVEDYTLLTEKTGLFGTQMQSINDQLHETALRWDELNAEERASKIQELSSEAQELAQSGKELRENWLASYGEVLDKGLEKIGKTTDKFEHLNSALEHYKNLMDLLGRSQNYKQIDKILQGQNTVLKNQMASSKTTYDILKGQMDDWQKQLANATTDRDRQWIQDQIDILTPELTNAYDDWLSLGEEYAQNLQDILTNSLTEAAKDLEDALTGDLGFDLLQSKIEALQAEDEVYLTETNQAYETNKLIRQAQIDIDKSTNKLHQEMLKKFQQETKVLQEQKQLSKDELEIQQLKYNLLVAQIALEDARDAKNQVRLMRDSQGNFNYVYTADQTAISEAEQAYADADNALYNKYLEVTNSNASLIQQIQQEFAQEAAGLDPTDPDYLEKINDLQKRALDKLEMYYEQYNIGIEGLGHKASEAWTEDMMKNIDSVRQFRQDSEQYINEVTDAYDDHADEIQKLTIELDLNYSGTAEKIGEITTKSNELKQTVIENKPIVEDALTNQANALVNWMKENDSVIDSLISRALKYSSLVNALQNTDGGYHAIMEQAADKRDRELFEMAANLRRMKVDATGNDYGRSTDDIYNELKWFNTGGYTGSWNGDSGKLAVLHEKELVLNKTDTANILSAVDIVRKVLDAVSLQNIASRYSLSNISQTALGAATTKIDQQVQITAEFPNATDKNEIKAAFDDIINEAVQYAGIRRV